MLPVSSCESSCCVACVVSSISPSPCVCKVGGPPVDPQGLGCEPWFTPCKGHTLVLSCECRFNKVCRPGSRRSRLSSCSSPVRPSRPAVILNPGLLALDLYCHSSISVRSGIIVCGSVRLSSTFLETGFLARLRMDESALNWNRLLMSPAPLSVLYWTKPVIRQGREWHRTCLQVL
jgi:hypothetical protein